MRFSFVTCTYNREKKLSNTLQSLVEQQFEANDFEIIVINNNSTDDTENVCRTLIEEYPNLHISYYNEMNQGLSFALNRGIKEAQGEFLIYVDDDETIDREHLSRLSEHLKSYPNIQLAASPVVPVYETDTPKWLSPFLYRLIGGYFAAGSKVKVLGKGSYPGTGHTIIKRNLYDQFGTYNTELGRKGNGLLGAEDKDMSHRLIANGIPCYYLPDIPIYHHIPTYKLTDEFFSKLTYSIGKSERIRTLSHSPKAFRKRLLSEAVKWIASLVLCFFYLTTLRPQKGFKLIAFRWNVTRGLLSKDEQ